jgi:hypothetical protein
MSDMAIHRLIQYRLLRFLTYPTLEGDAWRHWALSLKFHGFSWVYLERMI